MYVHLGRDYVLNDRDIIGIFNLETTTISPRGREFLNYAQKNGAVVSLSDELPQSYVLADSPVDTIYLSELSPAALKRRTETTVADLDSRVLQLPVRQWLPCQGSWQSRQAMTERFNYQPTIYRFYK